jgi:hypothetical protein
MQLPAGADSQLGEHLAEVILDRLGIDEVLGADLCVGMALRRKPRRASPARCACRACRQPLGCAGWVGTPPPLRIAGCRLWRHAGSGLRSVRSTWPARSRNPTSRRFEIAEPLGLEFYIGVPGAIPDQRLVPPPAAQHLGSADRHAVPVDAGGDESTVRASPIPSRQSRDRVLRRSTPSGRAEPGGPLRGRRRHRAPSPRRTACSPAAAASSGCAPTPSTPSQHQQSRRATASSTSASVDQPSSRWGP